MRTCKCGRSSPEDLFTGYGCDFCTEMRMEAEEVNAEMAEKRAIESGEIEYE